MGNAQLSTTPKLVLKRVLNAKRERVFDAWSKPELMMQWLVPQVGWTCRTRNDFRVGGHYYHEMIVGETADAPPERKSCGGETFRVGDVYMHEGEYLEIVPPEKLVFTWSSHAVKNSRVTIELLDLGESTELWLTHELLDTEELRNSHQDGWLGCMAKLEQFLAA